MPWLVGGLFTAQLVLNPFASSFRPGRYASHGPLRLLPVELTNINDLPINTNPARVRVAFGENPDLHDPPFQIYFLDDNAYDREPDRSFWVRGEVEGRVPDQDGPSSTGWRRCVSRVVQFRPT